MNKKVKQTLEDWARERDAPEVISELLAASEAMPPSVRVEWPIRKLNSGT